MMKKLTFLVLSSILLVNVAFAQQETQQIDSLMRLAHQRGVFNGNVLVAWKGKVIYEKPFGYADGSKKSALKLSMKFDVGSISKEFNGVAIMLLVEQHKLSLDDSLAKFFPGFPAWAKQVKVRHLINYTSGIPGLGPAADSTDALIFQNLPKLPALTAKPGTVYIYNHINVVLQRRIISMVSAMPYADFISKNLLRPAGMKATLVDYPVYESGMARAFDEDGHPTPYPQGTKGWIRLPVRDLYHWIEALHAGKIISAKSIQLLAENFPGGESSLGTTVYEGDQLVWHQHQGSNYNYEAAFYANRPEAITIVLMTNNQQMKVWPLKTAILNILHHEPYTTPKKSLYLSIRDKMLADTDSGLQYYRELKKTGQDSYDFSFEIGDLISTAKYLQRRNKYDDAIRVLQIAVQLQAKPQDVSYGYELIGDCYQAKGDSQNGITSYKKALEVDPQNKNAHGRLQALVVGTQRN